MPDPVYILGINCVYHELSAALLKDGVLVAAVEEERFSRIKHGKPARLDNPDTLPEAAMRYCLAEAGIDIGEVESVGIAFDPASRLVNARFDRHYTEGGWGSEAGEQLFYRELLKLPGLISNFAQQDMESKVRWIPHHICHAASAYFPSPYDDAAIMSIDGIGESASTWLGWGRGHHMRCLGEIRYPNSLGFLWEKLSRFVGFSEYDACKVMGLASYGDPKKFLAKFLRLASPKGDGTFRVDNDILRFRTDDYSTLEELFGVKKINHPDQRSLEHEHLVAALQAVTDEIILDLARWLSAKTQSRSICLAGGVALNCVSNYALMKSGLFDSIFVQPAAHDAGTALGAACYLWHERGRTNRFRMTDAYWGPAYTDRQIENALQCAGVSYRRVANVATASAKAIANRKIIGWFQGRIEWGPRALGNRSLLADPRRVEMKDTLNRRIKRREPFRPFAPSVLAEHAHEWFEIPDKCESPSVQFMEFTFPTRVDKRQRIPAVVHVDGTSRIQTVVREVNPKYHALIAEFYRLTGVPMVLNTSFNDNEPIVCSPHDAVATYLKTEMDVLAIGDFLATKDPTLLDAMGEEI